MTQSRPMTLRNLIRATGAPRRHTARAAWLAAVLVCTCLRPALAQVAPLPPMVSFASPWSKLGEQNQPPQDLAQQNLPQAEQPKPEVAQQGASPQEAKPQYLALQDEPHAGG